MERANHPHTHAPWNKGKLVGQWAPPFFDTALDPERFYGIAQASRSARCFSVHAE